MPRLLDPRTGILLSGFVEPLLQLLQLLLKLLRLSLQRGLLLRPQGFLAALHHRVRQDLLLFRQLPSLLTGGAKVLFDGGVPELLQRVLQTLPEALLVERHLLQRGLKLLRVHPGEFVAQFGQLVTSLFGSHVLQELLQLLQPVLEFGVRQSRVGQGIAQLGKFLLQRVQGLHHPFLALQGLRDLFLLLEVGLSVALSPVVRVPLALVALLEFAGVLLGPPRLLGKFLHAVGRAVQLFLGRALQFGDPAHPQRVLDALAQLARRMIVDHPRQVADRVARREGPPRDVQHGPHDRRRRSPQLHPVHHRLPRLAEGADPPHHDLDALHAVVVTGMDDQRLAQIDRHDRVHAGVHDRHFGGHVRDHLQRQRLRNGGRFATRRVAERPGVGARPRGDPAAFETRVTDREFDDGAPLVVEQRSRADAPASLSAHADVRPRGDGQRGHLVLILPGRNPRVGRIRHLDGEGADEEGVDRGEDVKLAAGSIGRLDPVAGLGVDRGQRRPAGPVGQRDHARPGDLTRHIPAQGHAVAERRHSGDLDDRTPGDVDRAGFDGHGGEGGFGQHRERVEEAVPGTEGARRGQGQHQERNGRGHQKRGHAAARARADPFAQRAGKCLRVGGEPLPDPQQGQLAERLRRPRRRLARQLQAPEHRALVEAGDAIHGPGDPVLRAPVPAQPAPVPDPSRQEPQDQDHDEQGDGTPRVPAVAPGEGRRQEEKKEHGRAAPRRHHQSERTGQMAAHTLDRLADSAPDRDHDARTP